MPDHFSYHLVPNLALLKERVLAIPDAVVDKAIEENPWFNEATIRYSLQQIANWLTADALSNFIQQYDGPILPPEDGPILPPKRIGIIMAGNIPLVGFHDLLMVWLSGHQAVVKPSHQDQVLIRWIIQEAISLIPSLASQVEITPMPKDIDFLIATGSNNSARYVTHKFKDTPRLIRKHRFSIGVIDHQTTSQDCQDMAYDLLLYHGLGCRSITNILVEEGVDAEGLLGNCKLERSFFSPLYFHKINREYARLSMVDTPPLKFDQFLARWDTEIGPSPLGVIRLVPFSSQDKKEAVIQQHKDHLQCCVGNDVAYGYSQKPGINDFADGVDTLKMLINC